MVDRVKQGVEIEGYIRTKYDIEANNRMMSSRINFPNRVSRLIGNRNLFKAPHYDTDHCTEIDLKAFTNLGELGDNVRDIISRVYELCNTNEWVYMLLGTTPVAWNAGGHIHNSIPNYRGVGFDYDYIKQKLYPFQPFIALLSQNSNLVGGYRSKDTKDARLGSSYIFSHWGSGNQGCLAANRRQKGTLECRYPSSSSYHQIIAYATLIKACIFQENGEVSSPNNLHLITCLERVIREGSRGIIYVELSKSLPILNIKYRRFIPLPAGLIFHMIINSPIFKDGLNKALNELSSHDKNMVRGLFDIIGKGYSFTDFYIKSFSKFRLSKKISYKIHEIGENAFFKDIPIWELVKDSFNPPSDKELTDIIQKYLIKKEFKYNLDEAPIINAKLYGIEDKVKSFLSKVRK